MPRVSPKRGAIPFALGIHRKADVKLKTIMKLPTSLRTLPFVIVLLIWPITCGLSCKGGSSAPTTDFFSSLTAWGTWPHTGTGQTATLLAPLRVRITSLDQQEARRTAAWNALQGWQKATKGRVSFVLLTDSPEHADGPNQVAGGEDILITQCDLGTNPDGTFKLGWTDIPGVSPSTVLRSTDPPISITHATIYLSSNHLSTTQISGTTLHECGHALGILSHSPDSHDLMYGQGDHVGQSVSQADLATLAHIYSL